jgi:hypothetical protein
VGGSNGRCNSPRVIGEAPSCNRIGIGRVKLVEGIVLVDGVRLAELMIEHGVGVSNRTVTVPKLDADYFEEG